jgi:hypothetical protein
MRTRVAKLAFNRGIVSRLGLARSDIKRLALAAEIQTNWVCRVLGSMMLRPGLGHLGSTKADLRAFYIPFIFSITDKAKIELTNELLRVWVDDALVTRGSVSSAVTNGSFDSDITGWTDADESGATSAWQAGGYMGLTGNGTSFAIRRQEITVAAADQGDEHALRIVIERGPVVLRVGSSAGDDSYINETVLGTGTHSLALTPTGNFWVEFKSRLKRIVLVDACTIEAAGVMEVTAPWETADLDLIRHDQSGDIVYVACDGYQQYTIERRATRSWSVVVYEPEDGPFRILNVSTTTIAAAAISGNTTLTASKPLFRSSHVGALFQITSVGQTVTSSITAENTFTNPIIVTGVDAARAFSIQITGLTASGSTVTLQRSFDAGASWYDVTTYTTDQTTTFDDGLDNQIIYYRLGVKTGDYGAGTQECTLAITTGAITGVARVTAFTSSTVVSAEILTDLGGTAATEDWAEGQWSSLRGFPSAVAFHEGRLVWSGRDKIDASISDGFDSFDPDFEGDAGPISRSIGSGPVDRINWLLSLQRLIAGGEGSEFSIRSSSLDEPLTPTNFNLKPASTQGSAAVAGVKVDQNGVFVQRGGARIFELAFGQSGVDYEAGHLSALAPEAGLPGITKILVQRQPDTRLHFIRSDGTVLLLVFDKLEEVIALMDIETDGEIEDGCILPGDPGDAEDHVYYEVARTISSSTKRYLEKWAFESECRGATLNKQADCFVTYSQAASATITGLSHLEGEDVVVWDNGKCLRTAAGAIATFTVSGGAITVTNAGAAYEATQGMVGLPYEAPYKSAKFVELMENLQATLMDEQIIKSLGLVLADVHAKGLLYGPSLTESQMRELPQTHRGAPVAADTVHTDYSSGKMTFPGTWDDDARLCLLAKAPRPCTVLAAIAEVEHHG